MLQDECIMRNEYFCCDNFQKKLFNHTLSCQNFLLVFLRRHSKFKVAFKFFPHIKNSTNKLGLQRISLYLEFL